MNKAGNRLKEPEEVKVVGCDETFFVSTIPATVAQDLLLGAMGAITSKDVSKLPPDTRKKLMSYVSKKMGDLPVEESILLDNDTAIDTYCSTFTLIQLELKEIERNFGFLFDGSLQKMLETMSLNTNNTETSDPSSAT